MATTVNEIITQSRFNHLLDVRQTLEHSKYKVNDYLLFDRSSGDIFVIEQLATESIEAINLFMKYYNGIDLLRAIEKTKHRLNDINIWNFQKVFAKTVLLIEMLVEQIDCFFDNLLNSA